MIIEIILVGLALLTGVVWVVDAKLFRPGREAAGVDGEPLAVEYARSFFPVIVIVLIIRSFLFEPFRIPSGSMMPTLLSGDFIFVNKFTYGLRLPVTNSQLIEFRQPERGDVVVFRLPEDPKTNYIKRLVGLPGDVVEVRNNQVFINGKPAEREIKSMYSGPGLSLGSQPRLAVENLDGVVHEILLETQSGREGRFEVPQGHYFFMGDNRDNSTDSRFPQVGYVPEANIVGKAARIWMNWDFPKATPIWSRIGDRIQ
ncbi:MAG: signal peptidase I [Gammaproteobacteria bacterium]|nr:signal peptidase I [Gammaproteobacteria bacterium]NND58630.1 signal peptidase I [Gammaproteobacteria bacterium]